MPCRIGITTEPQVRKRAWEDQVVNMRNWRILKRFQKFEDAQDYETKKAKEHGCRAAPGGGAGVTGPWSVYHFEFDREKG